MANLETTIRTEDPGYLSFQITDIDERQVIEDSGYFTEEELRSLWGALTEHFLSFPPEQPDLAHLRKPRPDDSFPNVGYVRGMLGRELTDAEVSR